MLHREAEGRNATILVVEDSPAVRKMVCAMLTLTGYNCLEASDGAEALRLLERAEDVQLVLTDVIMPNMDGAELAQQLSRNRPELRILFMSGYVEDSLVRSIGRTPLFLAKPFTATTLMEKVNQALDRPWRGLPNSRPGLSSV
jgi:two-component system cell cycle sensor histidine kinase/response regulator CckA